VGRKLLQWGCALAAAAVLSAIAIYVAVVPPPSAVLSAEGCGGGIQGSNVNTASSTAFEPLVPIMLCALALLLSNLGPNTTTFVLPSESFPTLARATAHGVCSASGKLGAVAGSVIFPLLLKQQGFIAALLFLVGLNISVVIFSLAFLVEMKQKPMARAVSLRDVELITSPLVPRFHLREEEAVGCK
jgi:hypothetical protein